MPQRQASEEEKRVPSSSYLELDGGDVEEVPVDQSW